MMESWQVLHIEKNLDSLIRNTICNSMFLASLRREILSEDDISRLKAKELLEGQIGQSKLLYDIVIKRKNAYDQLIEALRETVQTGSLYILEQAKNAETNSICLKLNQITVETKWKDLSTGVKLELGNKLVNFQNKIIKLNKCVSDSQLSHADGKFFVELCKNSESILVLVNDQVPEKIPYYIPRTIRSRNLLSPTVFQSACKDIFVFQNLRRKELTALAGDSETDVSGNQIHSLTVRFILLEYEGDFEKICKLARKPVHLIKFEKASYQCVKSVGSVKNLQQFVQNHQNTFQEKELLKLSTQNAKVFIISDSPGMGKTMLVVNIAHHIMQQHHLDQDKGMFLVRFIVMKEFAQLIGKKKFDSDSLISLIAEQSSEFEFGRRLIENSIKTGNCLLIFDGFDEVLSEQVSIALQILQVLTSALSSTPTAQVIVTTRPHMLSELENALHVLGYTINPFEEENQINFLLGFWETQGIERNETIEKFAKSCLTTLSSKMTDSMRNIAGIPFQCKLLAENYQDSAERCSKVGYEEYPHSISLGTSIFEMYERHMNMRLCKISENKSLLQRFLQLMGTRQVEYDYETIKKVHMYYALNLLFPEYTSHFKSLIPRSFIEMSNHLCGLGILETNSVPTTHPDANDSFHMIRFVHRTFAEYLVAWFVFEHAKAKDRTLATIDFFLSEILCTVPNEILIKHPLGKFAFKRFIKCCEFKFPVISYFINGFIKKLCRDENFEEIASQVSAVLSLDMEIVFETFKASAFHDYTHVPTFICRLLQPNTSQVVCSSSNKENADNVILISAKCASVELMKMFCMERDVTKIKMTKNEGSPCTCDVTPLHLACQRGHYNLVEYLVNKCKSELFNLQNLLHFCVYRTSDESAAAIKSKKDIIELLLTKSTKWLDEPLGDGVFKTPPLLQPYVDPELVEFLINKGANVNVCDEDGQNVLIKVIRESKLTPESFHQIVLALNRNAFKYFNSLDKDQLIPLFNAVKNVELLDDAFEIFLSHGADINWIERKKKTSILFAAIMGGRSLNQIELLIARSANYNHVNAYSQGVLHLSANYGHYEALKYFVKNLKMDINVKDNYFYTPLHYAIVSQENARKETKTIELMQRFLLKNGADINSKSIHNETPFIKGFQSSHSELPIRLSAIHDMEEHGLTIDNKIASDALKTVLSNTDFEPDDSNFVLVLEYLIKKQTNILLASEVPWNPWKFSHLRQCLEDVFKVTQVTPDYIKVAKTLRLLDEHDVMELEQAEESLKSKIFYLKAQEKQVGSFERTCLWLLSSRQMDAFKLLRSGLKKSELYTHFVTSPENVLEFLKLPTRILILKTKDAKLTISRLKDTLCSPLNKKLTVIAEHSFGHYLSLYQVSVLKWRVFHLTPEILRQLESIASQVQGKIVCLCSDLKEIENCEQVSIVKERICWEDISHKTLKHLWCIYDGMKLFFNELFASPETMFRVFGTDVFRIFERGDVCKMGPVQIGHLVHSSAEKDDATYLSLEIFNYFLQDKFVFQRINHQMLKQLSKFGQKIGYFGGSIENLDFIVLPESNLSESNNKFHEICKQTTNNVHLIEFTEEGKCMLVNSYGFDTNIRKFIENKQICNNFPLCSCEDEESNLFVNVSFQFQERWPTDKFLKCSVKMSELTPYMKQLKLPQYHLNLDCIEVLKTVDQNIFEPSQSFTLIPWCFQSESYYNSLFYCEAESIKSFRFMENNAFNLLESRATEHRKTISDNLLLKMTPDFANKWVHACVNGNYFNLLNIFCSLLEDNNSYTPLRSEKLVLLAVLCCKSDDLRVLKLVVEHYVKETGSEIFEINTEITLGCDFTQRTTVSIIHVAALTGNFSVIEFFQTIPNFNEKLKQPHIISNLLHYCVYDTLQDDKNKINQRKLVIDLFVQINPTLIHERNEELDTPLHVTNIHVDLITYLIDLGMDWKASNSSGCTILHLCPEYLSPQKYHKLVEYLHIGGESIPNLLLVVGEGNENKTPLHIAVEHLEVLNATFEIFSAQKVNFNAVDNEGNSVLMLASKSNRSARLLESLIRIGGADINHRNALERNILHVAAENGSLTAVRYLVTSFPFLVNTTDKKNRTPLHMALLFLRKQRYDVVRALLQNGASVNKVDDKNNTPLMITISRRRSGRTLQALVLAGADLQVRNDCGGTVLHEAVMNDNLIVLRYFLEMKCLNVNAKNDRNDTPLHNALRKPAKPCFDFVQLLVLHGADVNAKGENDDTPMSIAVEYNGKGQIDDNTLEILRKAAGNETQ
ncbi:unnamed protein product [Orchesella dallaii]|uniref:NACHT domain-containing protein n=1 Tax=Orchesella dallaii TaxID=48710 RepID=A0ABP1RHQ7_9HEXA